MVADPYSIVLGSVHKIQALKEAIERWRKFIGKRIGPNTNSLNQKKHLLVK